MKNNIISRLDDAITVFGRFLRQAGCTVGPREIMSAIEASSHIEIHKKQDFKQALQATLISNNKNLYLFNHLFNIFWKNPDKLKKVSSILKKLNKSQSKQLEIKSMKEEIDDIYRKRDNSLNALDNKDESEVKPLDLSFYSPNELLKKKRFDSYTNQELEEAKKFINNRNWVLSKKRSRRLQKGYSAHKLDIRNTIRNNIFPFQDFSKLSWKESKIKERPLVILMDISGSMDHYTRILMHFIHTLYLNGKKVEAFTFGTRLTRITKYIRYRNINDSIEKINNLVKDWSGGTRIGESVKTFNINWGRRVLGNGALVLMITDGWDTGDVKLLKKEFDRLSKSCHRLIWLNPNLGYQDFEPLTKGVQIMIEFVHKFLPIHNLNCLTDLADILFNMDSFKKVRFKS